VAPSKARIRIVALALALIAAAAVALLAVRIGDEIPRLPPSADQQPVGAVPIGGPFTLVDQTGQVRTEADFRGKFMLVYFGYTYCPDVCPMELATMSAAVDALGPDGAEVVPVFITIDPARDTVEHLKSFARNFHPRLVALTGTEDEVRAAARAYRVYYAKAGEGADGDDYLMDHTSIVYLIDGEGRYAAHFTHATAAEKMAARIAEFL
jgi:protein SCO1/2